MIPWSHVWCQSTNCRYPFQEPSECFFLPIPVVFVSFIFSPKKTGRHFQGYLDLNYITTMFFFDSHLCLLVMGKPHLGTASPWLKTPQVSRGCHLWIRGWLWMVGLGWCHWCTHRIGPKARESLRPKTRPKNPPNGGDCKGIPLISVNPGCWNIIIWPNYWGHYEAPHPLSLKKTLFSDGPVFFLWLRSDDNKIGGKHVETKSMRVKQSLWLMFLCIYSI